MTTTGSSMLARFFPEVGAGGFTRRDGTVEFYTRVNSLVTPDTILLDFGAGRGVGHLEETSAHRKRLRGFKGRAKCVYGVDVDPSVLGNPDLDHAFVLSADGTIPLRANSVDMIVADWVLEHLPDPDASVREMHRVLRQGGWICARTPNRWHYQYIVSRIIPDKHHARILATVQTDRKEVDVFPKYYRLNDARARVRCFEQTRFDDFSYFYSPEPAYIPPSALLWRAALAFEAVLPAPLKANMFIFVRKAA